MKPGTGASHKPLLGLILERENVLSATQVRAVMTEQQRLRELGRVAAFGAVALELRFLNERQLARGLQLQTKLAVPPGSRKPLGVYLLEAGLVTPSQLLKALEHQAAHGGLLGEILVERGWLAATMLEMFLKMQAKEAAGGS